MTKQTEDELKKIKRNFEKINLRLNVERMDAEDLYNITCEEDAKIILDRLKLDEVTINALPDGLLVSDRKGETNTFKNLLLKRVRIIRKSLADEDYEIASLFLHRLDQDYDNAKHDEWVYGVQNQFGKNAKRKSDEIREERAPVWKKWREEAERIKTSPTERIKATTNGRVTKHKLGKMIEKNLGLKPGSWEAIRKKI